MAEQIELKSTEVAKKVDKAARLGDKDPNNSNLSNEEMERAKLQQEFQRLSGEIRGMYDSGDAKYVNLAVKDTAAEYGRKPLEILEWLGVKLSRPFENTKYGITVDTQVKVWDEFRNRGDVPPSFDEFSYCDMNVESNPSLRTDPSKLKALIVKNRQYLHDMEAVKLHAGLDIKQYIYDRVLIKKFAKKYGKTDEDVKKIFTAAFDKKFGKDKYSGSEKISIMAMEWFFESPSL